LASNLFSSDSNTCTFVHCFFFFFHVTGLLGFPPFEVFFRPVTSFLFFPLGGPGHYSFLESPNPSWFSEYGASQTGSKLWCFCRWPLFLLPMNVIFCPRGSALGLPLFSKSERRDHVLVRRRFGSFFFYLTCPYLLRLVFILQLEAEPNFLPPLRLFPLFH